MAELVRLDKAASLAGKSEVTLRRLIKANKIPFQKEKTLTGFIYMVNPHDVLKFYNIRESVIEEAVKAEKDSSGVVETVVPRSKEVEKSYVGSTSTVRVAVAGEEGGATGYWQKRAERYEERYHTEIEKHSETKAELGLWRGRAEQSQAMLLKLLPAPQGVEIQQKEEPIVPAIKENNSLVVAMVSTLVVLVVIAVAGVVYLNYVTP